MDYVYDGSFEGFLTTVFHVFTVKDAEARILTVSNQVNLFRESKIIHSETGSALRVWNGLLKKINLKSAKEFYATFLSGKPGIEDDLLGYIRYVFANKEKVDQNFTNEFVAQIANISKMVYRERHRMEAFVRFKLTSDGIYYAAIEPDFNVLPLLVTHFTNRYADQRWLIYDLKLKYGLYYDLKATTTIEMEFTSDSENENVFHPDEAFYQQLWKDYFSHANIVSRKNMKLHIRHVPLRYWKHLVEKS